MKLYIAYFYKNVSEVDAEVFASLYGTEKDFIACFYELQGYKLPKEDIIGIYPVTTVSASNGKNYQVSLTHKK